MTTINQHKMEWSILFGTVLAATLTLFLDTSLYNTDPSIANLSPQMGHWLGTDHLGRDVLWRLIFATRAFVAPGLLAIAIALFCAVPLGLVSGFYGGLWNSLFSVVYGSISAIPRFVLIVLVMSTVGATPWVLAVSAGVAYSPALAEAVRGHVESQTVLPWVRAHLAWGFRPAVVALRFVLWGSCRPLIYAHLASVFSFVLVVESTLSYLGHYGVQEPTPSLGNMITFELGRTYSNPFALIMPILALWLLVVAARRVAQVKVRS